MVLLFCKIGNLEIEVNGIPQRYLNQLVKVPYDVEVTLNCKSQNTELVTFSSKLSWIFLFVSSMTP